MSHFSGLPPRVRLARADTAIVSILTVAALWWWWAQTFGATWWSMAPALFVMLWIDRRMRRG